MSLEKGENMQPLDDETMPLPEDKKKPPGGIAKLLFEQASRLKKKTVLENYYRAYDFPFTEDVARKPWLFMPGMTPHSGARSPPSHECEDRKKHAL